MECPFYKMIKKGLDHVIRMNILRLWNLSKTLQLQHPEGYFHRNKHLLKILFIHFNQFHVYIGHKK